MVIDTRYAREVSSLVDVDTGLVNRRIFYDEDIFQLEMQQIFARSWLFMCHESQIANPGDFFLTFMGEDRVIVTRDNEGAPQVLVNSCRHRGNAVCRAEEGHATSFMCTYHGWTFDLQGKLVGVPGFKEVYHEELDRENWGLIKPAQVDTYRGLVFANMDPEAPSLDEWLGAGGKLGLDIFLDRGTDMAPFDGIIKFRMKCNWKFPSDNSPDQYHGAFSHASAIMAGHNVSPNLKGRRSSMFSASPAPGVTVLEEYGHGFNAVSVPDNWDDIVQDRPLDNWKKYQLLTDSNGKEGRLGRINMNLFPNLFVATSGSNLALRLPRGPMETEIWVWSFHDRKGTHDLREEQRKRSESHFGPSGLFEQDDGENWDQSTRGVKGVISGRYPLNYSMGLGHGDIVRDESEVARVESHMNEHAQLWTYRTWADFMSAESWAELKQNHSRPQGTV
ncbi:MAG: Rieske 2Fe-2S domain-containing protein [Dehalococcoidia bacterium]